MLKVVGIMKDNGEIVGLRLVNLLFIPPNGESIAELTAKQQGKTCQAASFCVTLPMNRAKSLIKTRGCSNAVLTEKGVELNTGSFDDLPVFDKNNALQSAPCLVHLATVYQDEQLAGYFFIDTDNEFIQVPVSDIETVKQSVPIIGLQDKEELHYSSADKKGPAKLVVAKKEEEQSIAYTNQRVRNNVDKATGMFEKGGKIVIAPKPAPAESNNIPASFDGVNPANCTLNYKLARVLNFMKEQRPFYWGMIQSLTRIADEGIETMAVTPKKFFYSPTFVAKLRESNLVFVLIHEAMHIGMQHHARQGTRQPYAWNVACDLFINKCIVDEFNLRPGDYDYNPLKGVSGTITGGCIGITLPKDALFTADINIQKDTVEQIYDKLVQENPQLDQQLSDMLQNGNMGGGGQSSGSPQSDDGNTQNQQGGSQGAGQQGGGQDGKQSDNQNNGKSGGRKKKQNSQQGTDNSQNGNGQQSADGQQNQQQGSQGGQSGAQSGGQQGSQQGGQQGSQSGAQQGGQSGGGQGGNTPIDITYNGKRITRMNPNDKGQGTPSWKPDIVRTVKDFNNQVDEQEQATSSIMSAKKLVESCGKDWSKGLPDFMMDKLIDFVPVPAIPWTTYLRSTIMRTRLSPYETWSAVDGRGIASIRAVSETAYTEETSTLIKQAEQMEADRDAINVKLYKLCREKGIPTPKESLDACMKDKECFALLTELQQKAEECKQLREKAEEARQQEVQGGSFDTTTLPISLPAREQVEEPNAYLFAIDTSGSVDSVMLSKVMSEIAQIMSLNPKASIEIIYWGTQIVGYKALDNLNELKTYVKSIGKVPDGGGTDVNSVFGLYMEGSRWLKSPEGLRLKKARPNVYLDIQKHLNKQKRKMPILTIFTDGCFDALKPEVLARMKSKADRVLWVIQENPDFVNPLNDKCTNGKSKHSAHIVHTDEKLKLKD